MASAPNTGPFPFLSAAQVAASCEKENNAIESHCKSDAGKQASRDAPAKAKAPIAEAKLGEKYAGVKAGVVGLGAQASSAAGTEENGWVQDHCKGLWVKPHGSNKEKFDPLVGGAAVAEKLFPDNEGRTGTWGDIMKGLAYANPCITARRCALKPYKETDDPDKQAKSGNGCCPGQTGHHVMPGAMFGKGSDGKIAPGHSPCNKAYNHKEAPTMCLEGADNNAGSHGLAHGALDTLMAAYKEKSNDDLISYDDASAKAIESVREVNSDCSKECLQAQLDAFYTTPDCGDRKDKKLKANSGKGGGQKLPDSPLAKTTKR